MKTSKQKSTALGVKHVQGAVYQEIRDSSGLKKGTAERGERLRSAHGIQKISHPNNFESCS